MSDRPDWKKTGSNGEEFGDVSTGSQRDQRGIALQKLQKCESSFLLVLDEPEGIRFISALFKEDVDEEEMTEYSLEFLDDAKQGIVKLMSGLEEA